MEKHYDFPWQQYYEETLKLKFIGEPSSEIEIKFKDLWSTFFKDCCIENWIDYLSGNRENFEMSRKEFEQLYEKTGLYLAKNLLDEMIENQLISVWEDPSGKVFVSKKSK